MSREICENCRSYSSRFESCSRKSSVKQGRVVHFKVFVRQVGCEHFYGRQKMYEAIHLAGRAQGSPHLKHKANPLECFNR